MTVHIFEAMEAVQKLAGVREGVECFRRGSGCHTANITTVLRVNSVFGLVYNSSFIVQCYFLTNNSAT